MLWFMEDFMKLFKLLSIFTFITVISHNAQGMEAQKPTASGYTSQFIPPNQSAKDVLRNGQILGTNEEPQQMIERVVNAIASIDKDLNLKNMLSTTEFAQQLGILMDEHAIVLSTPILTNAGNSENRPLSACVMPPVNLRDDLKKIKPIVDKYHQDGMGTGYNLSDALDPIETLTSLNKVAVEGAQSKKEKRPVGNMAILDVDSPDIEKFVMAKVGADDRGEDWKFNISVNINDAFMDAVENNREFTLKNSTKISAKELFKKMAYAAHQCGDPGLISLERLNADNPTPSVGEYKCTAPCAEVGLAPGETCVFGYINLAKLVTNDAQPSVNFDRLKTVVTLLTRALDDILEISIQRYSIEESKTVMQAKRKIGLGICGFADMLMALNIPYDSDQARNLLQDILNFISYHSKEASFELAKTRGSFTAIGDSKFMDESFIMNKYGSLKTPHVSREQWQSLAKKIKETKLLRNATTSALPPTGRSAMVIGASTGIEPVFSLNSSDGIHPLLYTFLKKYSLHENTAIVDEINKTGYAPQTIKAMNPSFVTATEIAPKDHLAMVIAAQKAIDESISKTINLPEQTTPEQIEEIYKNAYAQGLKGMSVFRNNSRSFQPKKLTDEKK